MTDREKVIKKLAVTIQSDSEEWDTVELPIEQAKEILALLKEQEPKLIVYTDNPYTVQPVSHCPKCGKVVRRYSDYDDEAHYCPWCGQAVKFDD